MTPPDTNPQATASRQGCQQVTKGKVRFKAFSLRLDERLRSADCADFRGWDAALPSRLSEAANPRGLCRASAPETCAHLRKSADDAHDDCCCSGGNLAALLGQGVKLRSGCFYFMDNLVAARHDQRAGPNASIQIREASAARQWLGPRGAHGIRENRARHLLT